MPEDDATPILHGHASVGACSITGEDMLILWAPDAAE
jgi:hypothetical protein